MFAVVSVGSKQYTVRPGTILKVESLPGKVGDVVTFDTVLLSEEKGTVKVGTPNLTGVSVKAKILTQGKGEKIDVYRYKSKVRHRRHIGFRPHVTTLEVVSVG